jgi:hypothetical protein
LRQIWETADLSTSLRSGRDDKVGGVDQAITVPRRIQLGASHFILVVFAFLSVIPEGNLLFAASPVKFADRANGIRRRRVTIPPKWNILPYPGSNLRRRELPGISIAISSSI